MADCIYVKYQNFLQHLDCGSRITDESVILCTFNSPHNNRSQRHECKCKITLDNVE